MNAHAAAPSKPLTGEERFALAGFLAWFTIAAFWWALAFAPLPRAEAWLAAARAVCFGTQPNGLPEPWGWMLLVLAPAAILSFLLVVWGRPLSRAFVAVGGRLSGRILIGGLAAITLAGAASVGERVAVAARGAIPADATSEPLPDTYPRTAETAPPLHLIDQTGAAFELASLRGRPVILTFAYGHCATVCPMLVGSIRKARADYPSQVPGSSPPPVVVVTLDPWRDTPRSLPAIADTWGLAAESGGWLLTGPAEEVVAAAEAYQVGFARDDKTGEITHAGMVLVLDAEGRIAYRFLGPSAAWLVEAVRRLEPASHA